MNFEITSITQEHITDFWSAVDSVAREHQYLAFLEGPEIDTTIPYVSKNINENWPHFIAVNNGKIIGWCDISSQEPPVFAHTGTLDMGILKEYRGHGIGIALINAALAQAKQKGLARIELTVREKTYQR